MLPFLREQFGNASSAGVGSAAHTALERARVVIGGALNAEPAGIIFTASGTESNNLAIEGPWRAHRARGVVRNHIIVSAVEHPAVFKVVRWLEQQGARIRILPVDVHARVDAADLEREIGLELCW
jgi:cysteine desulfurase